MSGPQRLVLGTAQLGMPYGIHNTTGRPNEEDALKIVRTAWDNGIREFDTAQAYGESEKVLGRCFEALGINEDVRVISKVDPGVEPRYVNTLNASLDRSLKDLGVRQLYGLMLHSEKQLRDWDKGLGRWLVEQKKAGKTQQIGVSVYSPEKAREALQISDVDFIQVPANVFDRRCDEARIFSMAHELGKTVYARSVFLQGLLLMASQEIPQHMDFAKEHISHWQEEVQRSNLSARELALGFVFAKWPSAKVLFGAEAASQVLDNVQVAALDLKSKVYQQIDRFGCGEIRLLNPNLWKTGNQ